MPTTGAPSERPTTFGDLARRVLGLDDRINRPLRRVAAAYIPSTRFKTELRPEDLDSVLDCPRITDEIDPIFDFFEADRLLTSFCVLCGFCQRI
jgi:hypothetical protein